VKHGLASAWSAGARKHRGNSQMRQSRRLSATKPVNSRQLSRGCAICSAALSITEDLSELHSAAQQGFILGRCGTRGKHQCHPTCEAVIRRPEGSDSLAHRPQEGLYTGVHTLSAALVKQSRGIPTYGLYDTGSKVTRHCSLS
jgi:hypothetical protein